MSIPQNYIAIHFVIVRIMVGGLDRCFCLTESMAVWYTIKVSIECYTNLRGCNIKIFQRRK